MALISLQERTVDDDVFVVEEGHYPEGKLCIFCGDPAMTGEKVYAFAIDHRRLTTDILPPEERVVRLPVVLHDLCCALVNGMVNGG